MSWPETTRRTAEGSLEFGGVSAVDLAREFGTPLYVFDEETLRTRARRIRDAFLHAYERSRLVYAGKAYLSPALMRILVEEGIGLDVVSGGEIYAGLRAGVDPSQMIFHGNNKSRAELEEAVAAGVGLIAIDNDLEITLLESVARDSGRNVEVVLRLNPGVDVHTHHKMRTGAIDSKFGFPVWDGQAEEAAARICRSTRLDLVGYHAHVGSQIFDPTLVARTIDVIMEFAGRVHRRWGVIPNVVIPGGGFGVADDASGADVPIDEWAKAAAMAIERGCRDHGFPPPDSRCRTRARHHWPGRRGPLFGRLPENGPRRPHLRLGRRRDGGQHSSRSLRSPLRGGPCQSGPGRGAIADRDDRGKVLRIGRRADRRRVIAGARRG